MSNTENQMPKMPEKPAAPPLQHNIPAREHPDMPVLPPFIYLGFLIAAVALDLLIPTNIFGWGTQFSIGMIFTCFGFGLLSFCIMRFSNAGTNVPPNMPTTALVQDGPYAYSRNPIYFAFNAIFIGLCFLFDLFWGFILFAPLIVVVKRYVIAPEEEFLEEKFGDAYRTYKQQVRRWI